jgi:hypothetical protein
MIAMQQHHHRSTFVALLLSCNHNEEIYNVHGWGALCAFLGPVEVGGCLQQRNVLHSFAMWAQFRHPARKASPWTS